jgi:hypothetical protein
MVRPAGDSGRCDEPDLLRAAGGRRIDDDGVGGFAEGGGAGRDFLRPVQRPRQSVLLDTSSGREGRSGTDDASGTSLEGIGNPDDTAYSPQARSGRGFGTWQGRLPQELRLRGMGTLEQANAFLEQEYTAEFNQRFQVPAFQAGSAFLPCQRKDLDVLFSVQQVRVVSRDNTVVVGGKTLQIEATRWRGTLAGCSVTVCEHSDLS